MDKERTHIEAVKALKAFNSAVTTSRLYPPSSPQVAHAVEKAYQAIKTFSRTFGRLGFGKSDVPLICGRPADEDVAAELQGLVIYRHLDLLRLDHVVFHPAFDRKLFATLLSVFIARKEKITREGGGRSYVNGQGLEAYFPEEAPTCDHDQPEISGDDTIPEFGKAVSGDLLEVLSARQGPVERPAELVPLLRDEARLVELLVAGVAWAMRGLQDQGAGLAVRSPGFARFLRRLGGYVPDAAFSSIVAGVAASLGQVNSPALLVRLYCQEYPEGLGTSLWEALVDVVPPAHFDDALGRLRDVQRELSGKSDPRDPEKLAADAAVEKLLATQKGKLHLAREKARNLLDSGEQERRDRRLQAGIAALLDGNRSALQSEELQNHLPEAIEKCFQRGEASTGERLIDAIVLETLGGGERLRGRLIRCLVLVGVWLADQQRWAPLDKLMSALLVWIRESDEGDAVYEKAAFLLQIVMIRAGQRDDWERADQILSVFHRIRTAQLPKPPPIPALIGRTQDRLFKRPIFSTLLQRYLNDGVESAAAKRLCMMGRPAGAFLIDTLLAEEESKDRLRIIELLGSMGPVILDELVSRLPEPMPWYGKRNLIKLASEVAGPEQIPAILPFLRHDDLRVQREAFSCIYTISGEHRKQALIDCLPAASETMLVQIVKALNRFADPDTAVPLTVMLADQENYSEAVREPLIKEIVDGLARIALPEVQTALQQFLEARQKKVNRRLDPQLFADAEKALKAVSAAVRKDEGGSQTGPVAKTQRQSGAYEAQAIDSPGLRADLARLPGVLQVQELLQQGKQELAREAIVQLITRLVAEHRFEPAERLREWLMEIDPMALSEIIRTAELIEETKISAIDRDQVEAWSDLSETLTTEEFATFYHALKRRTYESEQVIVRQGDVQSELYFIASGKIRIFYRDASGDVLVKNGSRGEILGADTVFDASVWTVSVSCLARTEVFSLGINTLLHWREELPALESKLHDYCLKTVSMQAYFKTSGKDRRGARRHKVSGRVTSLLLDSRGRDTGIASRGELADISTGGVSFFLRISQKKNARLLLGRSTKVVMPMATAIDRQVTVLGTIIAVRGHQAMDNEYSVHVKFIEELSAADLQVIIKTCRDDVST